jgi:hypothetical protein
MRQRPRIPDWLYSRSLTLVMLALFAASAAGQVVAGWRVFVEDLIEHGRPAIGFGAYLARGHLWEALFENWESEFLQMSAFVVLTAYLYQLGSPESRRPHAHELVDADPRDFADGDEVPWPVRRGGWVLRLYEHSLGAALFLLFVFAFAGHALSGWRAEVTGVPARPDLTLLDYVASSQFWFESLQNWQSEFFSIAAMVWLGVYLRERSSPESKAVHAPHGDTGR